jgi:hypothetical protein
VATKQGWKEKKNFVSRLICRGSYPPRTTTFNDRHNTKISIRISPLFPEPPTLWTLFYSILLGRAAKQIKRNRIILSSKKSEDPSWNVIQRQPRNFFLDAIVTSVTAVCYTHVVSTESNRRTIRQALPEKILLYPSVRELAIFLPDRAYFSKMGIQNKRTLVKTRRKTRYAYYIFIVNYRSAILRTNRLFFASQGP